MSAHSLALTYTAPADAGAVDDAFWVRLEQEGLPDDTATAATAARLIDAVFAVEPCTEPADPEEQQGPATEADLEGPTVEDLETAAKELLDLAICDQAPDGSVLIQVRVIRSRLDYPYTLRVTGGEVVSTSTIETEHTFAATVADADQVQADYPVLGGLSVGWQGSTTGGSAPAISLTGTTFHWGRRLSGVLEARYSTRYDLAVIRVYGDPDNPGEQGEATVRCFCHGLVEELDAELPEPAEDDRDLCPETTWEYEQEDEVTCYRTVVEHLRCVCSGTEFGRNEYEEEVACPPGSPVRCPNNETRCRHNLGVVSIDRYRDCAGDGYVPGSNTRYPLSEPAYYEQICCYPPAPDFALPRCPYETRNWGGGVAPAQDLAHYRSLYGPATRLVGLTPQDKRGCGEWTIEHKVRPVACCDLIPEIVWDHDRSATIIGPNSTARVQVSGGRAPYHWRIGGEGFALGVNGEASHTTWNGAVDIYTRDACGTATVRVTDGCTTASGVIRSTGGVWELLPQEQWPAPMQTTDYAEVELMGGGPIGVTAYVGNYKVTQMFYRPWRSDASRADGAGWQCTVPTHPAGCTCACLVGLQVAQFGSAPEYISRGIAWDLYRSEVWHPYSEFYDRAVHHWYPSETPGVLCLDCAQKYTDYYPQYETHWQAARIEPGEQVTIWKWSCP